QTEDAERDTVKALERAPANLRSSMLLVAMKLAQTDESGAEQVLQHAVEVAPQSADALLALGRLHRSLHRLPQAEADFLRASQLDPQKGSSLVALAAIQMATGQKA